VLDEMQRIPEVLHFYSEYWSHVSILKHFFKFMNYFLFILFIKLTKQGCVLDLSRTPEGMHESIRCGGYRL
jgi:hypothetical protein